MNKLNVTIKSMTTVEVATITGKDHKNVKRDFESQCTELKTSPLKFEQSYSASNGQAYNCYALPKHECMVLISGYSIVLRDKIIKRWEELESKQNALSIPEQIHAMSGWMIKQDQKQAENENRLAQLEANADHTKQLFHLGDRTTVKIYCITNKIKIDTARASAIGKKCSGLCRDQKVVIGTSQDPTYGQGNSYPVWVIEEVLDLMGYFKT